ncbi:MAG: HlyC/CorC family transporter [Anaerolineales bacterium]|nr:HlyC/CorC family transporter [Anaerolineales bacterium]MCB8953458.1 HlyC/CorC family transporter [Ardenticatenales bacterium]
MSFVTAITIVALLVLMNALYVSAEFAAVKSRKTRLVEMAAAGNTAAQRLLPLIMDGKPIDDYVAACQVGITVSSLTLGAYGQRVLAQGLAQPLAQILPDLGINVSPGVAAEALALSITIWVILLIITTLQVVIGELFPKSVAVQYPERVALATVTPMRLSLFLFRPLIWLFNGSGTALLKLMGIEHKEHGTVHSPEEIEILVTASTRGGLLEDEERQMLRNTLRLRDLTARQVMVHRTRLIAAPAESSVEDLLRLCIDEGYTRIPLYQESVDHIAGIVHVKDLFLLHTQGISDNQSIVRDVAYVPETMAIGEVWDTLRRTGQYMVIVFDEYGGTAGLITLEDLIEEIFGEFQDEFDREEDLFTEDTEGRYHLRGDLLIADVNEYLQLKLPEEEADTLSGLILSTLGRVPQAGEEVTVNGTTIRVEKMADLGVAEISIPRQMAQMERIPEWEAAADDA